MQDMQKQQMSSTHVNIMTFFIAKTLKKRLHSVPFPLNYAKFFFMTMCHGFAAMSRKTLSG